MDSTQVIAMFLIILAIGAIWLDSQDRLVPVFKALTTAPTSASGVGKFALAFIVYLIAMSFLSPGAGLALTILLVAGALLVDQQQATSNGTTSVINQLFGNSQTPTGLGLNIPSLSQGNYG